MSNRLHQACCHCMCQDCKKYTSARPGDQQGSAQRRAWYQGRCLCMSAGLLSAMFMQEGHEVRNPDSSSGLHIRDRSGHPHRVTIPPDGLAFQMGEASQVIPLTSSLLVSCLKASCARLWSRQIMRVTDRSLSCALTGSQMDFQSINHSIDKSQCECSGALWGLAASNAPLCPGR